MPDDTPTSPSAGDRWTDLRERLEGAERTLQEMANDAELDGEEPEVYKRLTAKRSGVSLALSYMREYGSDV